MLPGLPVDCLPLPCPCAAAMRLGSSAPRSLLPCQLAQPVDAEAELVAQPMAVAQPRRPPQPLWTVRHATLRSWSTAIWATLLRQYVVQFSACRRRAAVLVASTVAAGTEAAQTVVAATAAWSLMASARMLATAQAHRFHHMLHCCSRRLPLHVVILVGMVPLHRSRQHSLPPLPQEPSRRSHHSH